MFSIYLYFLVHFFNLLFSLSSLINGGVQSFFCWGVNQINIRNIRLILKEVLPRLLLVIIFDRYSSTKLTNWATSTLWGSDQVASYAQNLLRVICSSTFDWEGTSVQKLVCTQVITSKHLLFEHASSSLLSILLYWFVVGKIDINASTDEWSRLLWCHLQLWQAGWLMYIVIVYSSIRTLLLLIARTIVAQDLLGNVRKAEFSLQLLLRFLHHSLLSTLWADRGMVLARVTWMQVLAAVANIIPDPEALADDWLKFVNDVSLCV